VPDFRLLAVECLIGDDGEEGGEKVWLDVRVNVCFREPVGVEARAIRGERSIFGGVSSVVSRCCE